jgi:hypothetical protein
MDLGYLASKSNQYIPAVPKDHSWSEPECKNNHSNMGSDYSK